MATVKFNSNESNFDYFIQYVVVSAVVGACLRFMECTEIGVYCTVSFYGNSRCNII